MWEGVSVCQAPGGRVGAPTLPIRLQLQLEKNKGEILGVVLVESGWGSILPTVILANMMNGGPAARSGKLSIGDQIMSINGTSLVGLPLATCQGIIKVGLGPCSPVTSRVTEGPGPPQGGGHIWFHAGWCCTDPRQGLTSLPGGRHSCPHLPAPFQGWHWEPSSWVSREGQSHPWVWEAGLMHVRSLWPSDPRACSFGPLEGSGRGDPSPGDRGPHPYLPQFCKSPRQKDQMAASCWGSWIPCVWSVPSPWWPWC